MRIEHFLPLIFVCQLNTVWAFYQWTAGEHQLELRGLVRAVASQEHQNQHHGQWAADLRWLADYHNDNTAIELHWLNHSKSELALLGRNPQARATPYH